MGALSGTALLLSLLPHMKCPSLLSAYLNPIPLLELVQGQLHQEACSDHAARLGVPPALPGLPQFLRHE